MTKLFCCSIGMLTLLLPRTSLLAQESNGAVPPSPSGYSTVPASERSRPLAIGECRSIVSAIYGERIEYFLKLPQRYESSPRRYPVLFVLNGDEPSIAANAYATLAALGGEMAPEMILIGIRRTSRRNSASANCRGHEACQTSRASNTFARERAVSSTHPRAKSGHYEVRPRHA
jgi:hypothetical protein